MIFAYFYETYESLAKRAKAIEEIKRFGHKQIIGPRPLEGGGCTSAY